MNTTLHLASVSFIGRTQKTAKTECGKVVSTTHIAVRVDADCPQCRAIAEAHIRGAELLLVHAKSAGLLKNAAEIEADLPQWREKMYRTVVFL